MSELLNDLLNAAINAQEIQTELKPVPIGEYRGLIQKVIPKSGVSEKTGKPYFLINVEIRIEDAEVAEQVGYDNPIVFHTVFLKVENGAISPSCIDLGRFIKATDGTHCESLSEILENAVGQEVMAKIVPDTYGNSDEERTKCSRIYNIEDWEASHSEVDALV